MKKRRTRKSNSATNRTTGSKKWKVWDSLKFTKKQRLEQLVAFKDGWEGKLPAIE